MSWQATGSGEVPEYTDRPTNQPTDRSAGRAERSIGRSAGREGGRAPRTSLKPRNSMSVGHNHMFSRRPAAGARGGPSQMMCEGTSHAWAHACGVGTGTGGGATLAVRCPALGGDMVILRRAAGDPPRTAVDRV